MARTKLKRIVSIKELKNVFSIHNLNLKNDLLEYFHSPKNLTLEIGCGNGDYSVEMALRFPERNFVGIDVKAARIFHGALKSTDLNLDNVAFVLSRAEQLKEFIREKSIEEIYIPFPDPHIKRSKHTRRLISHGFLDIYHKLLINEGNVHFKTDNSDLYNYALNTITNFGCKIVHNTSNLYKNTNVEFTHNIKTSFESHYIKQGREICYICFKF